MGKTMLRRFLRLLLFIPVIIALVVVVNFVTAWERHLDIDLPRRIEDALIVVLMLCIILLCYRIFRRDRKKKRSDPVDRR
ncbi:hypothetical protein [Dongia mobilis]|jgi:hypothetical protein|uniref:hypothetical protein n=1 Tax=Dongia sp. TaxID=1977262 RepID=UPI0026EDAB3A